MEKISIEPLTDYFLKYKPLPDPDTFVGKAFEFLAFFWGLELLCNTNRKAPKTQG